MEEVIEAVDRELLEKELTAETKICDTNFGGSEIHLVDAHNAPSVMLEVGRLRELSFRQGGGGCGKNVDIDEFDTMEKPYKQLIVWKPDFKEILGGYRVILGSDVVINPDGQPKLASSHIFRFSKKFLQDYLPFTIELGRAFVAPKYQSNVVGAHYIYTLDNLWDGLAALVKTHPGFHYFFGKMTIYPDYPKKCRDLLLYYLDKHYQDQTHIVKPIKPVKYFTPLKELRESINSEDKTSDFFLLKAAIKKLGSKIPPMISSYIRECPNLSVFGTCVNSDFFNSEETAILVDTNLMIGSRHLG